MRWSGGDEKKGSEQFTCNALRGIRRAKGVTGKLF
jgi:hypothetical protein